MIIDPGQLRERVRFDPRVTQPADAVGNLRNAFDPAQGVTRWALYLMRPGSEAVTEARLAGRQPVTVITRFDSATSAITADWRMTDLRTGVVYALTAPPADMERDRQWINFLCEAGAAP